jgi:hypothetical protein
LKKLELKRRELELEERKLNAQMEKKKENVNV